MRKVNERTKENLIKHAGVISVFAALTLATIAFVNLAGASTGSLRGESAAARQYLADTAPVNTVSAQFQAIAMSWIGNSSLTNAQAESAAKPLVVALAALRQRLQSQKWPSSVQHDVKALMVTFVELTTDLQALAHDNLTKTSSWEGPLLHDDVVTTAATNKVRHDLGIPALSSA